MPRSIVHLDADAFFASVEQAADTRLRGKPVAVGGEKRGIIASASYEARKFGVYTPMPTVRARKICPKLIILPGNFERYEQYSKWMFSYAQDFTPDVEIVSIDEGYFDLSGICKPAADVAQLIRSAIHQSLKITVSEGVGINKLVSQIASKLHKPDSFREVPAGGEKPFLHPLPVKWLPGVGPKTESRLHGAGLTRISHIGHASTEMLGLLLGSGALLIKDMANGIDPRPVQPLQEEAKSYGQQETFAQDLTDEDYVEALLRHMADRLFAKVREDHKSVRTLTVKVRYNDMDEDQCSESLNEPTDLETEIYGRLHMMLKNAWKRRVSLRMVGLRLSNLYDGPASLELALEPSGKQARERLAGVVDELRKSRGRAVILRGHDFRLREPPMPAVTAAPATAPVMPARRVPIRRPAASLYIPLNARSHYSFLDSTLSVQAMVDRAARYQIPAMALTDSGNLHGAVEFTRAARKAGVQPILGAEIRVEDSTLLVYVESAAGYKNLCHLLTQKREGDEEQAPGTNHLRLEMLDGRTEGLLAVAVDEHLADLFPGRFYQAVVSPQPPEKLRFPGVVCPRIHYAQKEDRLKFDVVQSIRTRTLLRQAHPLKRLNGDYRFRLPAEMAAVFKDHPEFLENTLEIASRCRFTLSLGSIQFPAYIPPGGETSHAFLRKLVLQGVQHRYGANASRYLAQVEEELAIIAGVGYEEYFLVVWDLLQECRRRGIEWITRGSAADSLVCYCLGISGVCPIRFDLYFRRFLNKERMKLNKLPDIDVDFPHDRKDEVVEMIFARYGAEHAAVVGGFSTFQARSAVADVGKVLGISEFQIRRFTEHFPWASASEIMEALSQRQECRDLPIHEEPYSTALEMAAFLDGFPRYPKMHPCGVVLSRQPMGELTPAFIANKGYATTHYDMDSVEAIGLVKMDILAQGGLSVMRDAIQELARQEIQVDLEKLEPWEDSRVWQMIASGGGRAVHHIESPAMIGLCRQTGVNEIDGLVAIVSVIRPGAANEQKKMRFIRRYQGLEPVVYPHPSLEPCLRSTFGLVVYEEHVLQICEVFAGLDPGRADELRRALGKLKRSVIEEIQKEFFASARGRGHEEETISRIWDLVVAFSGYAFCKAHSTAYAVEAYQAAWLKCYHPVEFMAGVLSNGKGFYHPLVYVLECHRLGIPLLPPSVHQPGPMFAVEGKSIRVPLTRVKGISVRTRDRIISEHRQGAFKSLADFFRRVGPGREEMEAMIRVGGFDCFGKPRTAQFWEVQQLNQSYGDRAGNCQGWLLPDPSVERISTVPLEEPTRRQCLEWEMELLEFPARGHPLELHDDVDWDTYCPVARLGEHIGQSVVACGLVIEQRTHNTVTGELMKFLTLADWSGIVETELFAATYRSYGLATVRYPVLEVEATVEPYENQQGFSLRVHRAGKPRQKTSPGQERNFVEQIHA